MEMYFFTFHNHSHGENYPKLGRVLRYRREKKANVHYGVYFERNSKKCGAS